MSIDWDDVAGWGGGVHIAAWCADRHDNERDGDEQ